MNKPPITVEEIEANSSKEINTPGTSIAYLGEERRSRAFQEMNFIYNQLQLMGEESNTSQLLEKVTESFF